MNLKWRAADEDVCPKCDEIIKRTALKCLFCRAEFTQTDMDVRAKKIKRDTKIGCSMAAFTMVMVGLIFVSGDNKSEDAPKPVEKTEIVRAIPAVIIDGIHLNGGKAEAKASGFTDCRRMSSPLETWIRCYRAEGKKILGVSVDSAFVDLSGKGQTYSGVIMEHGRGYEFLAGTKGWLFDPDYSLPTLNRYHPALLVRLLQHDGYYALLTVDIEEYARLKSSIAKEEKLDREMEEFNKEMKAS